MNVANIVAVSCTENDVSCKEHYRPQITMLTDEAGSRGYFDVMSKLQILQESRRLIENLNGISFEDLIVHVRRLDVVS